MRRLPLPRRRPTLGVAVAPDRVVIVADPEEPLPRVWCRALPPEPADAFADALADALSEAREALAVTRPRLCVALLPPLAHCRRVEIPALRDDETLRVLQRDAAGYFPGSGAPQVVGAAPRRGARPVLGAAACARVVDDIYRGAERAGCSIDAVVPAHVAWAAAAATVWAATPPAPCSLVTFLDGRVDVLRVERGEVAALRRLPSAPLDTHRLLALLGAAGESEAPAAAVALLGESPHAAALAERLTSDGTPPLAPAARFAALAAGPDAPAAIAAAFAAEGAAAGPVVVPERVRAERRRREARLTRTMLAAAGLLLAAAGAAELWGTRRELARVTAARSAIRGPLGGVLATRDTLAAIADQLAALRSAEAGAPRWSGALAVVAQHLPRDAYALSLRTEADSVVVEGVAEHAAPVFDALRRAPSVLAVRAQGSIRQEIHDGVGAVERFTLVARLAPPVRAAALAAGEAP